MWRWSIAFVQLQVLELCETHLYEMNGVNLSTALHRIAKAGSMSSLIATAV